MGEITGTITLTRRPYQCVFPEFRLTRNHKKLMADIASAYIMSKPPRPADAIKHLTSALELAPEDPEIAFNLAAVLESSTSMWFLPWTGLGYRSDLI